MNPFESYALKFNKLGWNVIPISKFRDMKRPLGLWEAWQKKHQTEEDIAKMGNPDANIAVITGEISGLTVVDIDPRNGGSNELFKHIKTPTVRTGGGGWHYYFKYGGIPCKPNATAGIDIKSEGGYVIVPPSHHQSGKDYEWLVNPNETPLAELPEFVYHLIPQSSSKDKLRIGDDVPEGTRNVTAARVIGSLVRSAKGAPQVVWQLAQTWNEKFGKPPMKKSELKAVVESILKRDGRQGVLPDSIASLARDTAFVGEVLDPNRMAGHSTGYGELDKIVGGVRIRTLTVLAAATGIGKSMLGLNILANLVKDGCKACYFDLENGAHESFERILRIWYGITKEDFRNLSEDKILEMAEGPSGLSYFSHDKLYAAGFADDPIKVISSLIQNGVANGVSYFLVDPLQAFDVGGEDKFYQQGKVVQKLKELAQDLSVAIIVCHHTRKTQSGGSGWVERVEDISETKYRLPTIDDLRGSGKIADFATDVWGMMRAAAAPTKEGRRATFVRILKNRSGERGDVVLQFDEDTLIYDV